MLGLEEWPAILVVFLRRQISKDRGREDGFDEEVVLDHHLLARVAAEGPEDADRGLGPLVPRDRPHDGLHVGDPGDTVPVPVGPVEAQRRTPVVDHERVMIAEVELFE